MPTFRQWYRSNTSACQPGGDFSHATAAPGPRIQPIIYVEPFLRFIETNFWSKWWRKGARKLTLNNYLNFTWTYAPPPASLNDSGRCACSAAHDRASVLIVSRYRVLRSIQVPYFSKT